MRFSGFYIDKSDDGHAVHQRPDLDRLDELPIDADCKQLVACTFST